MPTFKITTSAPADYYWYFEVEAESQEEAERMVIDGEVDPIDTVVEISDDDGIVESYEVTD